MKDINYSLLLQNVEEMINTHEYDGMRSPGKIRISCQNLVSLYALKDRYEEQIKATTVRKPGRPKGSGASTPTDDTPRPN